MTIVLYTHACKVAIHIISVFIVHKCVTDTHVGTQLLGSQLYIYSYLLTYMIKCNKHVYTLSSATRRQIIHLHDSHSLIQVHTVAICKEACNWHQYCMFTLQNQIVMETSCSQQLQLYNFNSQHYKCMLIQNHHILNECILQHRHETLMLHIHVQLDTCVNVSTY